MQVSDTFNCNYGGKPSLFWATDPNNIRSLGSPPFFRVRVLSLTPLLGRLRGAGPVLTACKSLHVQVEVCGIFKLASVTFKHLHASPC